MRKYEAGTRKAELIAKAHSLALIVSMWSPGDGVTRYKFFKETAPGGQDYWGPDNAVYTALGIAEAFTFLNGVRFGQDYHA